MRTVGPRRTTRICTLLPALLVVVSVIAGLGLATPAANAAPLSLPGTGSTSGGATFPDPTRFVGYDVPAGTFVRLATDSNGWPAGTTIVSKYDNGACVEGHDNDGWKPYYGFFTESCFYGQPFAEFNYTVTLPDGRVTVNRIRYTAPPFPLFPANPSASVDCRWGVAECELRGDYVYLFSRKIDSQYCTAEGYRCVISGSNAVRIVYASAADPKKRVEKVFPARADGIGNIIFQCTTSTFGGTDPDPGVGKYCSRA